MSRGKPRPGEHRLARLLGLALSLLLLLGGGLIFATFGGAFASYVTVTAELPQTSNAVGLGAPVEYRNVTVGTVASSGQSNNRGMVLLTIHMIPGMLKHIPAGVLATETPVSFFGDPYIVLQPPSRIGSATLRAGAVIQPVVGAQSASLQATLGDLDTLLVQLHPAQLDQALTALAQALQGQGTSLGRNLDSADSYFKQMLPLWPEVVADMKLLVPVANQFTSSSTDILAILSNQSTTAATINQEANTVRSSIGGGGTLASETAALLAAIQAPYSLLAKDSGPFLQDVAQSPTEVSRLLAGLTAWAKAWTAAEGPGPYLRLNATVSVVNPADLGLAVLGGPNMVSYLAEGLGSNRVNPATYSGPPSIPAQMSEAKTVAAELARMGASSPGVMNGAAETSAISQIVQAVAGRRPASPAIAALLLSPVLTDLVNR
jgi:phospholipid/cholesterol/gamma-HCH transport system substrate-binding protein